MARTRTDGFASGFGTGFGLVNDIYKQRADEEYQKGVLDIRQSEADATKRYYGLRSQTEQAKLDALTKVGDDGLTDSQREAKARQRKLDLEGDVAELTLTRAKNQPERNEQGMTPAEQLAYDKQMASLDASIATNEAQKRKIEGDELDERNALHSQNLYNLMKGEQYEDVYQYIVDNSEDIFNERSNLNLRRALDPRNDSWSAGFAEDMDAIAKGALDDPNFKLSDRSLNAMSYVVRRNTMSYIGKEIVSSTNKNAIGVEQAFANVPTAWKDKGMIIEDAGLFDLQTSGEGGGKIQATAWIMARDKDGDPHYYTAPVTRGASTFESEFADITASEGMQAKAAQEGYRRFMTEDSAIKKEMENYFKVSEYGSAEKFNTTKESRVNKIMEFAESQEPDSSIDSLINEPLIAGLGLEGLTLGQIVANRDFVERRVNQQMLYGDDPSAGRKRARLYLQDIDEKLPQVTWTLSGKGSSSTARGVRKVQGTSGTLDSLIKGGIDGLTQKQKSSLNFILDDLEMDQAVFDSVVAYLKTIDKFALQDL